MPPRTPDNRLIQFLLGNPRGQRRRPIGGSPEPLISGHVCMHARRTPLPVRLDSRMLLTGCGQRPHDKNAYGKCRPNTLPHMSEDSPVLFGETCLRNHGSSAMRF